MNTIHLTRAQSRDIDRVAMEDFKVPGVVLMENAGRGAAGLLLPRIRSGPVLILAGGGNNGGDGFVIARHLENRGVAVHVALLKPINAYRGDAAINLEILRRSGTECVPLSLPDEIDILLSRIHAAEWVVDAMLGTGTRGGPQDPYLTAIQALNSANQPVLAVDIPSGFDCDEGPIPDATVRASLTATLVAPKTGMHHPDAEKYLGEVYTIDIGMPRKVLSRILQRQKLDA